MNVLNDLIKTRNSIKRKLNELKTGKHDAGEFFSEAFKPITEPLNELTSIKKEKIKKENIKPEETTKDFTLNGSNGKKYITSTPLIKKPKAETKDFTLNGSNGKKYITSTSLIKKPKAETSNESFFESLTPEDDHTKSQENSSINLESSLNNSNSIEKTINNSNSIEKIIGKHRYDNTYGPYLNGSGKNKSMKIGNKSFSTDGVIIKVGKMSFDSTPGLMELIHMKKPDLEKYTEEDVKNYRKILLHSNAHKKNNDKNRNIIVKKHNFKYANFIKNLTNSSIGEGLLNRISSKKIEYTYFDDYDEIVERLKLLIASKSAGNNSHANEINSIIEELKEAKIIY